MEECWNYMAQENVDDEKLQTSVRIFIIRWVNEYSRLRVDGAKSRKYIKSGC